jgi:hypothetical protein
MEVDPIFTTNIKQRRSDTSKTDKRTIKYLATCTDPRAYSAVTRGAPDSAIRAISNAALNIEQGDIHLSPKQKALFRSHRKVIQNQKGGFFFIPALIGAALGAVGSKIIGSLIGGQQQSQQ